ncbi:hypothetical protein COV06_00490 [Candidatus Uhrbacteria bacterium CG10_big_fil_rev_8_21_14_0_10_50_16]|uniref:Bacterial spore germination immunoglobulin-like domain-containing protein n=1 Tax=Candidatus Uhrbacteria bacterium CG10_big_fil_rev_8_21_14_0_10_50_16 TaxID=1975039 RepID=A0A2H0RN46_9BACT|nr:MAG: hypothetical protein COV06_00490 [Candidatus Uhrbacteria bacterium CG10_big_fil_rev_8_21_14_0_10_50_16]
MKKIAPHNWLIGIAVFWVLVIAGGVGLGFYYQSFPEHNPQTPTTDQTYAFSSNKQETLYLTDLEPEQVIENPVKVTGEVSGTWYFEASFPVVLVNWDGLIIAEGVATAQSDWMTEELVPFTAILEFEMPTLYNRGALILKKDNPSGIPEYDDALEIPVRFW